MKRVSILHRQHTKYVILFNVILISALVLCLLPNHTCIPKFFLYYRSVSYTVYPHTWHKLVYSQTPFSACYFHSFFLCSHTMWSCSHFSNNFKKSSGIGQQKCRFRKKTKNVRKKATKFKWIKETQKVVYDSKNLEVNSADLLNNLLFS